VIYGYAGLLIVMLVLFFIIFGKDIVEVNGVIAPYEYQEISPLVDGVLKTKRFVDGDLIRKNDTVIEIDSDNLQKQLSLKEIELKRIEKLISISEQKLDLMKKRIEIQKFQEEKDFTNAGFKYKNGIITKMEYEYIYTSKEVKKLSYEKDLIDSDFEIDNYKNQKYSIELEIKDIQKKINQCVVSSDINGLIVEKDDTIKENKYYTPKDVILSIYSTGKIYAEVMIPEGNISKIEAGQPVKIFINSLPYTKYKVFTGTLVMIKKTTDKTSGFYTGKVEIHDPYFELKDRKDLKEKKLIFGMTLRGKIEVGKLSLIKKFMGIE